MYEAYPIVKFLHSAAAALFFGWAALAPLWLTQSLRLTELSGLPALRRRVTLIVITMVGGGLTLLWATGIVMGRVLSPTAFSLPWLRNGAISALVAAGIWLLILLPWFRWLVAARAAGQAPGAAALLAFRALSLGALAATAVSLWMMVVRPI